MVPSSCSLSSALECFRTCISAVCSGFVSTVGPSCPIVIVLSVFVGLSGGASSVTMLF